VNENLHVQEISAGNWVRIVNSDTSENLTVKSKMFPHQNIQKHTWASPDGKTHNQIDQILIHKIRH
jgi:hypothetical protein